MYGSFSFVNDIWIMDKAMNYTSPTSHGEINNMTDKDEMREAFEKLMEKGTHKAHVGWWIFSEAVKWATEKQIEKDAEICDKLSKEIDYFLALEFGDAIRNQER